MVSLGQCYEWLQAGFKMSTLMKNAIASQMLPNILQDAPLPFLSKRQRMIDYSFFETFFSIYDVAFGCNSRIPSPHYQSFGVLSLKEKTHPFELLPKIEKASNQSSSESFDLLSSDLGFSSSFFHSLFAVSWSRFGKTRSNTSEYQLAE